MNVKVGDYYLNCGNFYEIYKIIDIHQDTFVLEWIRCDHSPHDIGVIDRHKLEEIIQDKDKKVTHIFNSKVYTVLQEINLRINKKNNR